jgi:hypothetical protein
VHTRYITRTAVIEFWLDQRDGLRHLDNIYGDKSYNKISGPEICRLRYFSKFAFTQNSPSAVHVVEGVCTRNIPVRLPTSSHTWETGYGYGQATPLFLHRIYPVCNKPSCESGTWLSRLERTHNLVSNKSPGDLSGVDP